MGIRDFLEDVFYFTTDMTKAVGELGVGLAKVVIEGSSEFGEIMTDGVKEMVIKGNLDYKTSFEKKDLASEINYNARYRLEDAEKGLKEKIYEVDNEILNNHEYKKKLLIKLEEKINNNYIQNNLSKDIYINKLYDINFHKKLEFTLAAKVGLLGKKVRRDIADDYLNDAIDYKYQVNIEVSKIELLKSLLEGVKKQILEENRLLTIFEQALIKNQSFDYKETYQLLRDMVIREILDENGEISKKYLNEIGRLNHICSQFI